MVAPRIVDEQMAFSHEKALETMRKHAPPERVERMEAVSAMAHSRFPVMLAGFHAEMLTSLAEIVETQDASIEELDRRLTELEKAPAARSSGAKKAAKK